MKKTTLGEGELAPWQQPSTPCQPHAWASWDLDPPALGQPSSHGKLLRDPEPELPIYATLKYLIHTNYEDNKCLFFKFWYSFIKYMSNSFWMWANFPVLPPTPFPFQTKWVHYDYKKIPTVLLKGGWGEKETEEGERKRRRKEKKKNKQNPTKSFSILVTTLMFSFPFLAQLPFFFFFF